MAATKWKLYNTAKLKIGDGTIDLDTHTFKCALFLSTSNADTLTLDELGDLTNQVANGCGYTTGGATLAGVTWMNASGIVTFTCNPVSWTSVICPITARYAVIYDDTAANDPLVCICRLSIGDVTATDTQVFEITMSASGVFNVSGGNVN